MYTLKNCKICIIVRTLGSICGMQRDGFRFNKKMQNIDMANYVNVDAAAID